jgi:phosphoribosylformylglycinamidine synthase
MREVKAFARKGGLVLGICNGFQVLLELGLLAGAMLRNKNLKFLCQHVHLRVENPDTAFSRAAQKGQVLRIPIAHFDGNYYAPPRTLADLERHGQVVFRYCDAAGRATEEANVNGSLNNIAGLMNKAGNVLGLMPHPERASEALLGSEDGRLLFDSLIQSFAARRAPRPKSRRTKARHDR